MCSIAESLYYYSEWVSTYPSRFSIVGLFRYFAFPQWLQGWKPYISTGAAKTRPCYCVNVGPKNSSLVPYEAIMLSRGSGRSV